MQTFVYARVSTVDQTTDNQLLEIEQAGYEADTVYTDTVSGKVPAEDRSEFGKMLDTITRTRKPKRLIVTKLDRLGRDAIDILTTVRRLSELECAVINEGSAVNSSLSLTASPSMMARTASSKALLIYPLLGRRSGWQTVRNSHHGWILTRTLRVARTRRARLCLRSGSLEHAGSAMRFDIPSPLVSHQALAQSSGNPPSPAA